jgi:hypothetical protein
MNNQRARVDGDPAVAGGVATDAHTHHPARSRAALIPLDRQFTNKHITRKNKNV